MPGVGAGGLIAGLMNPGMDEKLARSINPLNQVGSPQGPQGSPPGAAAPPGGQPPQQPQQAPAAVTAPDPYVASAGELLLKAQRVSDNANAFNQGLSGMAASFGTAQQQHDKMAALGNGANPQDLIGQYGGALKDQNELTKQQEHARFMGMVDVYAQTHGISREEAQMRMNNEGMLDADARAQGANETQTGNIKDAEAATREWAKANPNATPQQVADYKANLLAGGIGGSDLDQRQYLSERQAAVAAGKPFPDFATWKADHATAAATKMTEAKDAQKFKDDAVEDFGKANDKLTRSKGTVDRLLKNIDNTMTALATPDMLTSGKGPAWLKNIPVIGGKLVPSDETTALAHDIRTLKAELTGSGLTDVKNVRNRMEFETLGNALTAALDAANSPEDVRRALIEIKQKFAVAQANTYATAGKEIPHELGNFADPKFLTRYKKDGTENLYYTGATIADPPEGGDAAATPDTAPAAASSGDSKKELPSATADWIKAKLTSSPGEKDEVIKHFEKLGYDMSKYK